MSDLDRLGFRNPDPAPTPAPEPPKPTKPKRAYRRKTESAIDALDARAKELERRQRVRKRLEFAVTLTAYELYLDIWERYESRKKADVAEMIFEAGLRFVCDNGILDDNGSARVLDAIPAIANRDPAALYAPSYREAVAQHENARDAGTIRESFAQVGMEGLLPRSTAGNGAPTWRQPPAPEMVSLLEGDEAPEVADA